MAVSKITTPPTPQEEINKINEIIDNLGEAGSANQNLSNLSSAGEARLHALKGYSDEGELLTDAEGLADVTNYTSSNITGVDTIKHDDYTIVGSPTITTDGIASGFSTSNYIIKSSVTFDLNTASSWSVILGFTPDNLTSGGIVFNMATSLTRNFFDIRQTTDGKIRVTMHTAESSSSTGRFFDYTSTTTLTAGSENIVTITHNSSGYFLYINGTAETASTTSTLIGSTTGKNMYFGAKTSGYAGSIDLNNIKIYTDGSLVYQACLKVPYIQSKTGSKIVNALYRSRITDMYTQLGYAPYYTLSDTDFTLPQGDIYGLMNIIGSNAGFPSSNKYKILTIGANLTEYIAPTDGYFVSQMYAGAAGERVTLILNRGSGYELRSQVVSTAANQLINTWIPAKRSAVVTIAYDTTGTSSSQYFRFVPTVGNEWEI